jgi:hypothetical protein
MTGIDKEGTVAMKMMVCEAVYKKIKAV